MRQRRSKPIITRRPPDLIDQAQKNLGDGADPCSVVDSIFDAYLRALKKVPVDHPQAWALTVGHYTKLAAIYEQLIDAHGEAGSHSGPRRPVRSEYENVPGQQYTPATSTRPRR